MIHKQAVVHTSRIALYWLPLRIAGYLFTISILAIIVSCKLLPATAWQPHHDVGIFNYLQTGLIGCWVVQFVYLVVIRIIDYLRGTNIKYPVDIQVISVVFYVSLIIEFGGLLLMVLFVFPLYPN